MSLCGVREGVMASSPWIYGHGEVSFLYGRKKCLLLPILKPFNPCVEFLECRGSSALCHGVRGGSRLASFCWLAYVFYIELPLEKKSRKQAATDVTNYEYS